MTREEIKGFYERCLQFETRQLDFANRQIEWLNKYIKEYRQKDREFVEWVWSKGVVTENEMKWYNEDYKSDDLIKELRERDYYYRSRKKSKQKIEKYTKELEKIGV